MLDLLEFIVNLIEFIFHTITYWRFHLATALSCLLAWVICTPITNPHTSLISGGVIILGGVVAGVFWQRQTRNL